jgi:lipopolysaccharide export system permease protein
MTLSLYVARRFLGMVARVFLIFFGILMLIDVIEQLRRFSDRDIGLAAAIRLALMSVPESLYRILPLILIMASIALFLGLARSSELVVVRAAGRSGLRFLVAPVLAALAIGVLAVAVMNPLVAATTKNMTGCGRSTPPVVGQCCPSPTPGYGCGRAGRMAKRSFRRPAAMPMAQNCSV